MLHSTRIWPLLTPCLVFIVRRFFSEKIIEKVIERVELKGQEEAEPQLDLQPFRSELGLMSKTIKEVSQRLRNIEQIHQNQLDILKKKVLLNVRVVLC